MIEMLLVIIILFEILRLYIYIKDSRSAKIINKRVEYQQERFIEMTKQQDINWKKIRKAEINELKQLAKDSDTMKLIYDEWIKEHKGEK